MERVENRSPPQGVFCLGLLCMNDGYNVCMNVGFVDDLYLKF